MRWVLPTAQDSKISTQLQKEVGLPAPLADILLQRGLDSPEKVAAYLDPRLRDLSDPFLLPGVEGVVERLLEAIHHQETVVLHGDYDVDGISSLAVMARVLEALGAHVHCFLPSRVEEGYGLTRHGLERCLESYRPHLLVAIDCGTNSAEEIAWLEGRGVETVVIDHHEPEGPLPVCRAFVNPKVLGGDVNFCSAGLTFKVCHALLKRTPSHQVDLKRYLDLVALGTVADLVPLRDENRILTRSGLARMRETCWNGLRALQEVAAVGGAISASDVSFRIGPRLNAAGRLGDAEEALQLLLTSDPEDAKRLAHRLDYQNRERQTVEQATVAEAMQQVADLRMERECAIVVGGAGWHPGVVGIAASRLSRHFNRPAIVVGFDQEGMGRGSGRGVEGFALLEGLKKCGALLERFGGHSMAVGLSVRKEHFVMFRSRFLEIARQALAQHAFESVLGIDALVSLARLDDEFLDLHEKLAPFGMGNNQPVFCAGNLSPLAAPVVMKEKHLRFTLVEGNKQFDAVYFNAPLEELPEPPWDVAFQIERSIWRAEERTQLHIRALRTAAA